MILKRGSAIAFGVLLAACSDPPPHGGSTAAPPPVVTAVGPIPGPQTASTAPANPYAADRTAMGEGRQLFVRFNCSGCHGGRAGGGMGPSLRDVDWLYGSSDEGIFSSIAEGQAIHREQHAGDHDRRHGEHDHERGHQAVPTWWLSP